MSSIKDLLQCLLNASIVISVPAERAGKTIYTETDGCAVKQLWNKHPSLLTVLFPAFLLTVAVIFPNHSAEKNKAPDEIIRVPNNLNLSNYVETGVYHNLAKVVRVAAECVESICDQTSLDLKCKILLPVSPKHQNHTHTVQKNGNHNALGAWILSPFTLTRRHHVPSN